jgi:uncharacterized membrane protein
MTRWFESLRMMYQRDKPQRLPRIERDPARVVFFSDAVFAIAVTLLVLGIEPPDDFGNLPEGLGRLWPSYLAYAISFLLIGQVWVNHHVMFEHIRSIDRRVLFLNTLLLMVIAFLPFSAALLAGALDAREGLGVAVVFYGTTLWAAALLFNVLWAHARRGGLVDADTLADRGRPITIRFAIALVWIGVGTVLGVFVPVAGVAVIAAFIPAYYLPIRGE